MTTTDHAAEAERLIQSAGEFMSEGDAAAHDRCIATAQVHATLATAARGDTAGMKQLVTALLTLASDWHAQSAEAKARADRLGNCAAGKEAAGDAGILRSCAEQLTVAIAVTGRAG